MKKRKRSFRLVALTLVAAVQLLLGLGAQSQSVPPLLNYQGRLTDQTGAPLPAGSYVIQFRLWDSATLSSPSDFIWGQQQTVALQTNGVFNVILGSPGGIPITNPTPQVINLAYAFAGSNCFLGVTVVSSNGVSLSSPTEIVPRQQLLSVPFAFTAGSAQTVVPGAITSASIATGAVTAASIANGAIAPIQLAARVTGTNVPLGGIAISPSCGLFSSPTPGTPVDLTNFNVQIFTGGNPVEITFAADNSITNQTQQSIFESDDNNAAPFINLYLFRDGLPAGYTSVQAIFQSSSGASDLQVPPGSFKFLDFPSAGVVHTYKVQISGGPHTTHLYASYMRMIVREY